jgi:hypothetical protein
LKAASIACVFAIGLEYFGNEWQFFLIADIQA